MAIRTFVALDLDTTIRRAIADAAEGLPTDGGKVRWVEPQNLHVTLKFLGDVPDADVVNVCRAVEAVAGRLDPLTFDVVSLECTPDRGPVKMIWAGSGHGSTGLRCRAAGVQAAPNRRARPLLPEPRRSEAGDGPAGR